MDEKIMQIAIKESKKALINDEMPVGAVLVYKNKIIAKSHNKKNKTKNAFKHAEIEILQKGMNKIGDWRLKECDVYVTLEPCIMCTGAILETRINNIYYCMINKKSHEINKNLYANNQLIHCKKYEEEYKQIITQFFNDIRKKNKSYVDSFDKK